MNTFQIDRSLSIEQLENDFWTEPEKYPTRLTERCFKYRKIPIGSLSVDQLRTLIFQKIGTAYLIDIVMRHLQEDVLTCGNLYPGDLLEATLRISDKVWEAHTFLARTYVRLIERHKDLIEEELGEKSMDRLLERVTDIEFACNIG